MISFYGIFAAGFATRPLGALIFGWISDRYSRKTALMLSIVLMSIPTALVGCLPTYQTVGVAVSLVTCMLIAYSTGSVTNACYQHRHTVLAQAFPWCWS